MDHRLMSTCGEVDDLQAQVPEPQREIAETKDCAVALIRAAVGLRIHHGRQHPAHQLFIGRYDTGDAAHNLTPAED